MLIYRREQEDGLGDRLRDNRLLLACLAQPTPQEEIAFLPQKTRDRLEQVVASQGEGQFDLYYFRSVLVSTGINKNDDFFPREDTFAARHTPIDKPLNYQHDRDDIIGHMTACQAVNEQGSPLAEDCPVDDLPDRFHLVDGCVLYRYCQSEERQKRTDRLIVEIAEGKWYVSMECLFAQFDYVLFPQLRDAEGRAVAGQFDLTAGQVVARNAQTSFLTKHLRAYGGSGIFDGKKLGRVLRQFTFSGKGLVSDPANPDSVIFAQARLTSRTEDYPEKKSSSGLDLGYATQQNSRTATTPQGETEVMTVEMEKYQTQINELTTRLAKAEADLRAEKDKNWESRIAELEARVEAASKKNQELNEQLAKAQKAQETLAQEKGELKSQFEKLAEEKAEADRKLQETQARIRSEARVRKLQDILHMEESEARSMAETLEQLSDEQFDKNVETLRSLAVKLGESKVSSQPAPMSGKPTVVKVIKAGEEKTLPEKTTEAPLAVSGAAVADEELQATQADILDFFADGEENSKK